MFSVTTRKLPSILLRNKSLQLTNLSVRSLAVVPFKLADIGEGIAEVELMKWFVKAGDKVKSFDRICEVQSDKATVEITSRYDGVIATVHHEEGSIVKVGSTLVDIETAAAANTGKLVNDQKEKELPATSHYKPQSPSLTATTNQETSHHRSGHKILTTPAVRKIAKENHIDLAQVTATGPKGRITKEDVLVYLQGGRSVAGSSTAVKSHAPVASQQTKTPPVPSVKPASTSSPSALAMDQKVPIRGVQRMMVKSMTAALQVQHLTYCEEISFDKLKKLRNDLKVQAAARGVKLSYMPIMIKATSMALLQFPMLNATVNAEVTEMTYHANHNIGIAMDTPRGLVVPVLKQVQNKSILEIAADLGQLQEAAMNGAITEAQLSGGTFSLSNIGSVGGTYAVPVLVVPQVIIGAFGRLQMLPRYVDKDGNPASNELIESGKAEVKPSTLMNVSWSADHRVIDGATVAKFSNLWKYYLENPHAMLSELR